MKINEKSIGYYLVLLILKIKGVKRVFSQTPIDYHRLRRDDVKFSNSSFGHKKKVRSFFIDESLITEIKSESYSEKLIIFIHGGAYVSGPTELHWKTVEQLYVQTNNNIWFCEYPKAPEYNIETISRNIDEIYKTSLKSYGANNIVLMGDSVGASLILSLIHRLPVYSLELPNKLVLISPVIDASFSNPMIRMVEDKDPMLSTNGALSAKLKCADGISLMDPMLSPLFASFTKFSKAVFFLAESDITFPDQQLFIRKLNKLNFDIKVVIGSEMPHIWPLMPFMSEAKIAMKQIVEFINTE